MCGLDPAHDLDDACVYVGVRGGCLNPDDPAHVTLVLQKALENARKLQTL